MKTILFAIMLTVTFQACSERTTSGALKNSKWVLAQWPGKNLPVTKQATLNFDGAYKISGKSFCNGYGGIAILKDDTIKFDQILGTMMYCEDVGDAEKNYLNDLKATTSFKIGGNQLKLYNGETLLMVFSTSR